jgi:ribosomal protein S18 acetylase RimI-like enzyme
MSTPTPSGLHSVVAGRPASELSDAELEAQGTQAHATRNWVFLHGTAEQFARHTSRMLELEQEYLHRHPHRTWQGSGGAPVDRVDDAAALRAALRGIASQIEALAAEPARPGRPAAPSRDPVLLVLDEFAQRPDGRLHKLEVHQAARIAGLDRAALAALYSENPPLLSADRQDRVITDAGLQHLRRSGWRPVRPGAAGDRDPSSAGPWSWRHEERPVWDEHKARVIGAAEPGAFDLSYRIGDPLPGDWWSAAAPDGRIAGYGWMDVTWGEAEILLAVDPELRGGGVGSFVLDHLEVEAAARGLNYVYNTVSKTHPRHDEVQDWLGVRGYQGSGDDGALRKHVRARTADGPAPTSQPAPGTPSVATPDAPPASDLGPGHEDRGGYVDVEDHRY